MMRQKTLFITLFISISLWLCVGSQAENNRNIPQLEVKNDQAIVTYRDKTALKIPLRPSQRNNNQEIWDGAELIGQCLVVRRHLAHIEGMESFPSAESIELYTLAGKRTEVPDSDLSFFEGYPEASPSSKLGAIFQLGNGAEGDVDKFLLLRADCSYIQQSLNNLMTIASGGDGRVYSDPDGSLVVENMGAPNRSIVIKTDGTFSFREEKSVAQ